MDLDWCLTCEKRVEGSSPYCSPECQDRAGPSAAPQFYYQPSEQCSSDNDDDDEDDLFHTASAEHSWRWIGNDRAGISAWAADIPAGAPVADSASEPACFQSPSTPTYCPPPPNLLRPHRRVVPPSLSMTTPPSQHLPPSTPVVTPRRHNDSTTSLTPSGYASMGQTSLRTAVTDSSLALATPVSSHPVPITSASRKPSMLDMYSHVRSWASPSPALASIKQRTPQPNRPTLHHLTPRPTRVSKFQPVAVISSPRSSHGLSDPSAVYWMAGSVLVDQAAPKLHTPSRGRPDMSFRHDDHPSFRTRGRKASRAAA